MKPNEASGLTGFERLLFKAQRDTPRHYPEENVKAQKEKVRVMRHIRAFKALPDDKIESIVKFCMLRSYPKGHVFYPEQENLMYVLAAGEADVCVPSVVFGNVASLDGEKDKETDTRDLGAVGRHTSKR